MSCGGVCSSCRILHSNGLWTGIWSPSTWFALVMLKLSLPKQKALDGMLNGRPVYVLWVVPQAHKEICPPQNDWTSFVRGSIVFPPSCSDHKETLKRAQSTPVCNVRGLLCSWILRHQNGSKSAPWQASLYSVTAETVTYGSAPWCLYEKIKERDLGYSASSGARELCSMLWVVLELYRDLWNPLTHPEIIPLDGQFWKWHTFGIAYNFGPNQEPGISRCSINVSDWLIKKIKLFQCNWFQHRKGNTLRSNLKDLTKQ